MRIRSFVVLLAIAVAALTHPARLLATDGYFMHGYGTGQKGMAGAGVALLFGPSDAATNPASGVFSGPGLDFGIAAFSPDRQFEVTGTPSGYPGTFGLQPGTVVSDNKWFPVPHVAATWMLGQSAAFGISMYGNGGMNTTYNKPVFGGSTPTGVNLSQMFVAPNVSFKVATSHAIGASVIVGYQWFEAKGLQAFTGFSSAPASVTNNDSAHSYGAGFRLGYLGQIAPSLTVGVSYQSRVKMTNLDKYAGLFAQQGDFDIPSNWVAGIGYKPSPGMDIAFDVQRVNYSEVKSIGNPMLPNLQTARLGDENGAGFGWRDMTIVKVGVQFKAAARTIVRAGYSYGQQPIPESEVMFNILAPGVIQQHLTAGLTQAVSPRGALHLAVTRALPHDVTGPNPLEAPNRQQITLSMSQWDLEVGYTVRFGR
jgi:long-chain fatty acid transport protein